MGPAVLLTACEAIEVRASFVLPDDDAAQIDSVVLRVFQPPAGQPFDCAALAFQGVAPEILEASLVERVTALDGVLIGLGPLDRLAPKVLLSEALVRDEIAFVGCAELGEVAADRTVRMIAEPVVRQTVLESTALSGRPGTAFDGRVRLRVEDVLGRPASGVPVRWELGGAGPSIVGTSWTEADGATTIAPDDPGLKGPIFLELRARWSRDTTRLDGFLAPAPTVLNVEGRVSRYRVGAIGPSGERGFIGIFWRASGEGRLVFGHRAGSGWIMSTSDGFMARSAEIVNLPASNDVRDRVLVVTDDAWIEVLRSGALARRAYDPPALSPPAAVYALSNCVAASGPCSRAAPRVLVSYGTDALGEFSPDGVRCSAIEMPYEVLEAGCLSLDDGESLETWAVDGGADFGLALIARAEPDRYSGVTLVAIPFGLGFTPSVGGGLSQLLATQLEVNDFVVTRSVWKRDGEKLVLATTGLDSPPGLPVSTAGGDIDGDGRLDIVSLLEPKSEGEETSIRRIWVALGREHRGQRIHGAFELWAAGGSLHDPVVLLMDFDGDGADEILVGERHEAAGVSRTTRVEVYAFGAGP